MGGEERRELIYEGFVNYRLNQGDSEAEAKAYADGHDQQRRVDIGKQRGTYSPAALVDRPVAGNGTVVSRGAPMGFCQKTKCKQAATPMAAPRECGRKQGLPRLRCLLYTSLENTYYTNATGLPDDAQYTTARDVAALSVEMCRHPDYFTHEMCIRDRLEGVLPGPSAAGVSGQVDARPLERHGPGRPFRVAGSV